MKTASAAITVLICTYNRVTLLAKAIASLNAANRLSNTPVRLLVVANACTDGTHAYLEQYQSTHKDSRLPLQWVAEPTPGKSHALNRALTMLEDPIVAFVDDDHRVDRNYLISVAEAMRDAPGSGLVCGRILPDWDGQEPTWVHDTGPYRIYPLPIPRYDQGDTSLDFHSDESPLPGGGNLVARLGVVRATGPFATDLGPTGHDLGGSEDLDWILRALRTGATVRYDPHIIQYHYVDHARLRSIYLMRKGFQRSKSVMRFRTDAKRVPLYMWHKAGNYAACAAMSVEKGTRRFYLVRLASSLGEISGVREQIRARRKRTRLPILPQHAAVGFLGLIGLFALLTAGYFGRNLVSLALIDSCIVSGIWTLALVAKSLRDFSQTGPKLRNEILHRYRGYVVYALSRLALVAFVIALFWGFPGAFLWQATSQVLALSLPKWGGILAASFTFSAATFYTACRSLALNPGLIIASWQYRTVRMHTLWRTLSPRGLHNIALGVALSGLCLVGALALLFAWKGSQQEAIALVFAAVGYGSSIMFALWEPEGHARGSHHRDRPNIVMIGCDTLRADRIGAIRNGKSLTPNIDALAARATLFSSCYVPCARTAPSLISLFTGTWPHTHGIRDNFVATEHTRLKVATLPQILRSVGYRTATVSDWCGADLGKFDLGFDITDLPGDQWNLKYLIRQGPKDIRLFLSLFLHNRIGRYVLPEVYYLGGVPQSTQLGKRARRKLRQLSAMGKPFLLNIFYSTTHPPFASEHPYYLRYTDPDYAGESKFAMAKLTEPFEIIRQQGKPREEFDLDQILALYDGCVAQFDSEVGKLMHHMEEAGLKENTIVVLYSDHGMEFFEHGTWGQGNSAIGDFSARIPLLISTLNDSQGQRVEQVVRSIDLLPTLLDLLGIPVVRCDGVSLSSSLKEPSCNLELSAYNETGIWATNVPGLPPDHLRYPDLFELLDVPDDSSGTLAIKPEYVDRIIAAKDRMLRRGRWKFVYQPLEEGRHIGLYDLETDSGCLNNIATSHREISDELWSALQVFLIADGIAT